VPLYELALIANFLLARNFSPKLPRRTLQANSKRLSAFPCELGEKYKKDSIEAGYSSESLSLSHHEQDGTGCCSRWCDTGIECHAVFVAKRVKANSSTEMTMEPANNEC
jgi:hypothetical protein